MIVSQSILNPIPCKTLFRMPAGETGAARWAVSIGQMEIDFAVARGKYRTNAVTRCLFVVLGKNGLALLALLVHNF